MIDRDRIPEPEEDVLEPEEPGKPVPRNEGDEVPGRDEVTPSSQGVGAIWGDAERTPHPGPVREPGPIDEAAMESVAEEYEVVTTEDGERYLEPRDEDPGQGTTDDFPDHQ